MYASDRPIFHRITPQKRRSDKAFAPGGDGFIPGGDHANLMCLAWNRSVSAWRNSPCLYMEAAKDRNIRLATIKRRSVQT